jgi:hypothetical protein
MAIPQEFGSHVAAYESCPSSDDDVQAVSSWLAHTMQNSSRPTAVRRRLLTLGAALGNVDEALQLAFGHAVAQLRAARTEATQLPLA